MYPVTTHQAGELKIATVIIRAAGTLATVRFTPTFVAALMLVGCGSTEPPLAADVEHFLTAQEAIDQGDTETALTELNASIGAEPSSWAYLQRAKIHADSASDEQALADCKAGLKLDPANTELKWLESELKKAPNRRFQGRFAEPPTAGK